MTLFENAGIGATRFGVGDFSVCHPGWIVAINPGRVAESRSESGKETTR